MSRSDSTSSPDGPAALRSLRGIPWRLALVVAFVLLTAPFATSPVRDAATLGEVPEVTLVRPFTYVLFAPLSNVLDTLSLLSARQHVAVLVTLVIGWLVWVVWRTRRDRALPKTGRESMRLALRALTALVALVGTYALAVFLPRPMAALQAPADVLVVDFHAHTEHSHDGRSGWDAEDVRRWHADAGYDAAYITDHRTFEGARRAWANNPGIAGQGTMLFSGLEAVWRGEHVNILDADRVYRGLTDAALRDVDQDALVLGSAIPGNEPVLIETIPGKPSGAITASGPGTAGVRALELVDGSPRGLGQSRLERSALVKLADSANLALVAGSDHHGWGYTAPAWTLLRVPLWRNAQPTELAAGIGTWLRRGGRSSTRVVERTVANTERGIALPLTLPIVAWQMGRTLDGAERITWIAWAVLLTLVARGWERRRAAGGARAS